MGSSGVIVGLRGMLKALLMIAAAMTFGCVSMELRSAFMMFGGSCVFFFWHCLTPLGDVSPYLSQMDHACALLSPASSTHSCAEQRKFFPSTIPYNRNLSR